MIAPLVILLAQGTAEEALFEPPFRLEAGGIPIELERGHAAAILDDFDGDGMPDLLVGAFDGKLRIYVNVGAAAAPRFEGFAWFRTGEQEGRVPTG